MGKKEIENMEKKIDHILAIYFDELMNRFEKKQNIMNLQGWLRANLLDALAKTRAGERFERIEYVYYGVVALVIISILDMLLSFFYYLEDII